MFRFLAKKRVAIPVGIIAALAISGVAFAYWTTSGSGTATGTTGTGTGVTVAQSGTITGMVPGGTAQAVNFVITNPASTPQYITSVAVGFVNVTATVGGTVVTGCGAADFTLVQPTAIGANVAAGNTTYAPSGATIAMNNLATNQDACKSGVVNLSFTAA
jgi:hypothetical protein